VFVPQKDQSVFYTLGDHSIIGCGHSDEVTPNLIIINLLLDEIPSYADCPYIVTKDRGDKLIFSDIHRWAEPFGDACIRILHDRLSEKLQGKAIVVSSMHTIGNTLVCDYRLSIDFDDMIYNDGEENVIVKCTWTFFDYEKRRQVCIHKYAGTTPVDEMTYDNVVHATKAALTELADDITEKICRLDLPEPTQIPSTPIQKKTNVPAVQTAQ
jgi:uncharacterized lipoprotein YmbA